ncbi:RNA-binding domain-containing protein [Glonium stellatum]|uniref:RNA-binding domain-containing protein n=1 Tax=Glonium stellatum TaxID=574774 RepID=A0A8E2JVW9_9PEZI|nr:RNA-binding domain-containing protein [Glonium stellatum]
MATSAKTAGGRGPPANPPNQTLYCKNLPDKLQKADLRRSLYLLFATYGPILDIVALKTPKMRGQAHIVFRDIQASTQAMRALQGFEFFGKEMKLSYAKSKSDTISKLDGTFKLPTTETATGMAATELQKSVFGGALPGSVPAASLSTKDADMSEGEKSAQGVKRRREEESDQEDASMEEDDEGAAMEESDSD